MLDRLFRPSCPCDSAAKAWVEERLEWLVDEFDDNAFGLGRGSFTFAGSTLREAFR